MFSKSIRWRIQVWHGGLLVGLVASACVGFFDFERRERLQEIDSQLQRFITPLWPRLTPFGPRGRPDQRDRRPPPPGEAGAPGADRPAQRPPRPPEGGEPPVPRAGDEELYYIAWTPERAVSAKSGNIPGDVPYRGDEPDAGNPFRTRDGFRELIHQVPNGYVVLVGASTGDLGAQLHRLAGVLAGGGFVVIPLGLAGGWGPGRKG